MRFTKPSATRHVPLPMTSLIDVVFLLLIYFIVTARFAPSETEIASGLQAGSGGAADEPPRILRVLARGEGGIFQLGGRTMSGTQELTEVLRLTAADVGVAIEVADDALVSDSAAALQAAQDAELPSITYVPAR